MGFGRAGSAAGLCERPGPWPGGPSRARLPPLPRRPAPALGAWFFAGAAAQAEFPGALAGSGSGRSSPENLLIRRGRRGGGQSAREGEGPAQAIGQRSGGPAPRRTGPRGARDRARPREGRAGEGAREKLSSALLPGPPVSFRVPVGLYFSVFLGDFSSAHPSLPRLPFFSTLSLVPPTKAS